MIEVTEITVSCRGMRYKVHKEGLYTIEELETHCRNQGLIYLHSRVIKRAS